jgi:hypothetical protein
MFGALLILAAAVLSLVQHNNSNSETVETDLEGPEAEERNILRHALWTASSSLSIVLVAMTHIALLNRPLDKPKTLVINSRWIRLAPRIPAIVLIMCLPLFHLSGWSWCGLAPLILYIVFLWEFFAGMERGWKWFESKAEI